MGGIDLAGFTNILQYVWGKTKYGRDGMPYLWKWGPFNCCLAALFLCMADLTRHLVNDAWGTACTEIEDNIKLGRLVKGAWDELPDKYNKYCYSRNVANEFTDSGALSIWGWTTSVF